MPSKGELMNLSHAFGVTLSRIVDAGGKVTIHNMESQEDIDYIEITPLMKCRVCNRLSLAECCLWCDEEFHGEGVA